MYVLIELEPSTKPPGVKGSFHVCCLSFSGDTRPSFCHHNRWKQYNIEKEYETRAGGTSTRAISLDRLAGT